MAGAQRVVNIFASSTGTKVQDVRTTVTIDDQLFRRAKAEAARTGRTLGALIEDGLRVALAAGSVTDHVPDLPTYGGTGTLPGVDLSSNVALAEVMDGPGMPDALR